MLAPASSSVSDQKTFRWTAWQSVKHQFFDTLMLIGMRDRLRCPKCTAVGTWKPHGGWCDRLYDWWTSNRGLAAAFAAGASYATNRRWLCKYCGWNVGTEGENQCYPDAKKKVWALKNENSTSTPKDLVDPVWPWRG